MLAPDRPDTQSDVLICNITAAQLLRHPGVPGLVQRHLLRPPQRPGLLLSLRHCRLWLRRPGPLRHRGRHEDPHRGLPGHLQHQDPRQHRRRGRSRHRHWLPPGKPLLRSGSVSEKSVFFLADWDVICLLPGQHHQERIRNSLDQFSPCFSSPPVLSV